MNRRNSICHLVPLLFVLVALDLQAQQPARDADLGTSAEAFERFDDDYRRAVEAAVPRFDGDRLAERLRNLHARHPQGVPGITATDAAVLARQLEERIPDLRPRQAEFDSEKLSLGVDTRAGMAWFHRDLDAEPMQSPRNAERMAPTVARQHAELLTRLGVTEEQRFFVHQAFTMRSSAEAPGDDGASREERPQVDGIATLVLRSVDGIQVEGGLARLSSRQAGRLQDLELRWPQVRMHPTLRRFDIKQRDVVLREVLAGVERTASGPVNVRTAVVLRPVLVGNDTVHVPSLRVGVLPDNGEAGDLFYVDLSRESVRYRDGDAADEDQAGRDQEGTIGLRGGPHPG